MSLGDWEVYKNNAAAAASIETAVPLVGSGSLKLVTGGAYCLQLRLSSAHPRGFLQGKIRTLIKRTTSMSNAWAGLYCMASQADLSSLGACYLLAHAAGTLYLQKLANGVDTSGTNLQAALTLSWPINTTVALELEWAYDLAEWGGCKLIGRSGTALDFSDLTQRFDVVDSSSPLATTVGEGVVGVSFTAASEQFLFDETTVFELL